MQIYALQNAQRQQMEYVRLMEDSLIPMLKRLSSAFHKHLELC